MGEEVRLAVLAAQRRVRVFDAEYGGDFTRLNAIELQDLHDAYYLLGLDEHADEIEQELRFRHEWYPKLAALESRFGRGTGLTFRERLTRAREMEFYTAFQNGEAWAVDASRAAFDAHVREMRADTKKATAVMARGRERRSPQCRTTRRSFAVTSRRSRDTGGGEPPGEPEPARRRHWAGCRASSTCGECGHPLVYHGGVLMCVWRLCSRWGRPQ